MRPFSALLTVSVFVAAVGSSAEPLSSETIIEARQRLMVSVVRATKIPRAMVQGEAEFDGAAVDEAVKQVLEATSVMPRLFPDGSIDATSATLPLVFSNRVDFEARFLDLEKAAVMLAFAAQRGPDELAYAFGEFEATCESCHAKYRKPD